MKRIEDVKVIEGKRNDVLKDSFIKVGVYEDYMGNVTISFPVKQHKRKSIFVQFDYELDAIVDSMYEWKGEYYILDEYFSVAE